MTRVKLLEDLKNLCVEATEHLMLPTAVQKGDTNVETRPPDVYKMRLPDSNDYKKKAPYMIIQYVQGRQKQGIEPENSAVVRIIFCVYSDDEQVGSTMLLNVMDCVEHKLMKDVVVGDQYHLDVENGIESLVYTDETAPYYGAEITCTFYLPEILRKGVQNEYI